MVCYGLTLAMLGTATPLIRAELEDRLQRYESALSSYRLEGAGRA